MEERGETAIAIGRVGVSRELERKMRVGSGVSLRAREPRAEACGCHPASTLVAIVLILGLAGCVV